MTNPADKSRLKKLNVVTFNSISVYLLSLPIMFLIHQFANVITALSFDIPTVLYHNKVKYLVEPSFWTHKSVIITFGLPPIICLFIGGVFTVMYYAFRKSSFLSLLFLWMGLQGINYSLGSILVGIVTGTGFHHVTAWLYMKMPLKVIIAIICLVGLLFTGFYVSIYFLKASPTHALITKERRFQYMTRVVFYPWLVSSVIYLFMMLPNNFNSEAIPMDKVFMQFTMLIIIIPAIVFNGLYQKIRLVKQTESNQKFNWATLVFAVVLALFLRAFIASGIHFGDTNYHKKSLKSKTSSDTSNTF